MDLKMVLACMQLVLLIVGVLTFVYAVYAMYNHPTANTTGKAVVTAYQMFLYAELVVQLLQLVVGGLTVYKM